MKSLNYFYVLGDCLNPISMWETEKETIGVFTFPPQHIRYIIPVFNAEPIRIHYSMMN